MRSLGEMTAIPKTACDTDLFWFINLNQLLSLLPHSHLPRSDLWNLLEGKLFLCHLNQPLLSQRFKGSVLKQERAL
jgi:hypothetical protein